MNKFMIIFKKFFLILIMDYYFLIYYNRKINNLNLDYNKKQNYIQKFLSLKSKPTNLNDFLIIKEKNNIIGKISKTLNKKIKSIKNIVFNFNCNFGNCLIFLNKCIFYCEILGCQKIILKEKYFWFIKKDTNIWSKSTKSTN
jgi:hypothetical protein